MAGFRDLRITDNTLDRVSSPDSLTILSAEFSVAYPLPFLAECAERCPMTTQKSPSY